MRGPNGTDPKLPRSKMEPTPYVPYQFACATKRRDIFEKKGKEKIKKMVNNFYNTRIDSYSSSTYKKTNDKDFI